ncbi:hypothetical protein Tco_0376470, partial [Tanacetum coccineum]
MKRGRIKLDDIDGESDEDDKLEDSGCRSLLKVEQFFILDKVKENTKLSLAILHLEGKALLDCMSKFITN